MTKKRSSIYRAEIDNEARTIRWPENEFERKFEDYRRIPRDEREDIPDPIRKMKILSNGKLVIDMNVDVLNFRQDTAREERVNPNFSIIHFSDSFTPDPNIATKVALDFFLNGDPIPDVELRFVSCDEQGKNCKRHESLSEYLAEQRDREYELILEEEAKERMEKNKDRS